MDILELFKYLIAQKSETPDDGGLLDFVMEYLQEFTPVRLNKTGVKNLFIYKKFGEGEHLCFAGHVDVVPAGEGWDVDPYGAVEKDGYIYGRGTQDMKSGVVAFLQAVKETTAFNGTLSLLLTSDAEGPAQQRQLEVLKYREEKEVMSDPSIVAAPTGGGRLRQRMSTSPRRSRNGGIEIQR